MNEKNPSVDDERSALEGHQSILHRKTSDPAIAQLRSQLNNAEADLRESRAKFQAIFDGVVTGIFIIDPESHQIVDANPIALELVGAPRNKIVGAVCHKYVCPAEHGRCPVTDLGQTVDNSERILLTVQGQKRSIIKTVKPVEMEGHRYLLESFLDITSRKQAEQALQSSEERYRELFENASDLVYTFDLDMGITSLNRLAEQTIGYTSEEAMRMNLRQLVDAEHWARIESMIGRLVAGYPLAKFEVEIKAKDGRRVMLEVNPRVILKDGKAAEIQGIARDITGRDAAEIELRQAQKLESVGRLATGIAHEINTPMQFVGDNVRFLQDSFMQLQALLDKLRGLCDPSAGFVLPPAFCAEFSRLETEMDSAYIMKETPDAIVQTLDGIERVVTIVRAMKEFAHPEDKGMAHADINRALLNTLTVARNELKYVAEVVTDFGDLPLVVCSLGDMNQVFLNLLVNAAHAIGDMVQGTGQKGTIRIETRVEGLMALIAIADTGAGIPEKIRDRIFDPFFTTKEVGRGTGQGLAIARSVIERHKGSLTFESEVGKGTTFRIGLPIEGTEPRVRS
ncbi:MAG: PAS domain S-box protein [Terracidiphilus sp.]